jgi:hypothetical protein
MAFIPVLNTVSCRLVHSFLGQPLTNTLYVNYDHQPDFTDLTSLASVLVNAWSQQIMPNLSTWARFVSVSLRDLTTSSGVVYDYSGPPLPVAGGELGSPLPSSVAIVLSLRTGLAGRSFRGRLFIGGFSENQSDGNYMFNNLPTVLKDRLTNVIDAINTADRRVVVVSRYNEQQARPTAVVTPVTSVLARTVRVASQRKRLPQN